MTLVVVGGAAVLSWSRTPNYVASADVLVPPRIIVAGTTPLEPDMGSELAVAESARVREIAARAPGVGRIGSGLSVGVALNTHVLHISYSASTPRAAQRNAQAFADAYVTFWLSQQATGTSGRAGVATRNGGLRALVITPATLPTAPSSPNHAVDLGIAVAIGLILGIGTAWVRDRFDDRLRGVEDLEAHSASPVLATISRVRGARRDVGARLVTLRSPMSQAAAPYQDLRRLLVRQATQQSARSLLVTSPLGDCHAAVAANLAVSLARTHKRVVLVCADMGATHGRHPLGTFDGAGLADVLEGRAGLAAALHETGVDGLRMLPAGRMLGDTAATFDEPELRRILRQLRALADTVVIDAPAALGAQIGGLGELAEMIVLVADARHTTRAQVRAATGRLAQYDNRFLGCVLDGYGRRAERVERVEPERVRNGSQRDLESRPAKSESTDTPASVGIEEVGRV
ncbi:MAG: hypothetical protein M3070_16975 [Actinomycetota bacterium]|nr:hypothetical protein [Actinomycetota bacterium]